MMEFVTPVVLAAAVAIHELVQRRLVPAAQPLRLKLAEKGEQILARSDVSSGTRSHVDLMLNTAFGMRSILFASYFLIPVFAVLIIFRQRYFDDFTKPQSSGSEHVVVLHDELTQIHHMVSLANHPIMLPLVELELLMFIPFAIIIRALIRGTFTSAYRITRESVMNQIGERVTEAHVLFPSRRAAC